MANENLGLAEELVHDGDLPSFPGDLNPTNIDDLDELGGFASDDELAEFLATFNDGSRDEASIRSQGEGDVGGEPITTIH